MKEKDLELEQEQLRVKELETRLKENDLATQEHKLIDSINEDTKEDKDHETNSH